SSLRRSMKERGAALPVLVGIPPEERRLLEEELLGDLAIPPEDLRLLFGADAQDAAQQPGLRVMDQVRMLGDQLGARRRDHLLALGQGNTEDIEKRSENGQDPAQGRVDGVVGDLWREHRARGVYTM